MIFTLVLVVVVVALQLLTLQRMGKMASSIQVLNEKMAIVDEAADELAKDLKDLRDKILAGAVTPEEIAALVDPRIARLQALGKDPVNPDPEPPQPIPPIA